MKSLLNLLGLLLVGALVAGAIFVIGFWLYWWWTGMFTICTTLLGIPWWVTLIVVIAIGLCLNSPAPAMFTIVGFVGWIWVLNWHWYTALMVYLPTISIIFISAISVVVLGAAAGILKVFDSVVSTLKKPWK